MLPLFMLGGAFEQRIAIGQWGSASAFLGLSSVGLHDNSLTGF